MTKPFSIKLRLKEERDNLFVRLSERTVKDLLDDASASSFLPLAIALCDTTVYTSWNGGISEYDDTIEIPSFLLSGLSPLPTMVEVKLLTSISPCTKVHVEPVSANDWELLQCDSAVLQRGGFLQQVSVVYSKQHLHLKMDNDWVELLVGRIESSNDDDEKIVFGLLRQDTEVIIAPRTREKKDIVDWSPPQTLIPSQDDWNEAMLQLHKTMELEPLSLAPGCVLVNEMMWNSKYSWATVEPCSNKAQKEDQKRLVRVICNKSVPEGNAVLHKWLRQDLGLALYWKSIRLRPTSTPRDLSLEDISLVPIQFNAAESIAAFRKPSRTLHDTNIASIETTDAIALPLSCIFEANCLAEHGPQTKDSVSYFRLVDVNTENPSAQLGGILTCNQEARDRLAELCTRTKTDTEPEVSNVPEHENFLSPLSAPVVSSHSWAENAIDSLRKDDQLWITIWGESGSGKSHSALLLSAMCKVSQHAPSIYLDCKRLKETTTSLVEILNEIDSVFELAVEVQNCIIVFDDMDLVAPNLLGGEEQDSSARVETANPIAVSQSKVIADRVLQLIEATRSSRVSILATSTSMESIHSSFHDCLRIPKLNMEVPVLSSDDRVSVLEQLVGNDSSHTTAPISKKIGQKMDGFRPHDLEKIASRVRRKLRTEGDGLSINEAVSMVIDGYIPLSHMALNDLDHKVSTTWEMIGGLSSVKLKLESLVLNPVKYKLIYEKASIKLPRGVLLFGPPGCGKSALVPALAQFCKFPVISCKGPEIFDKYIGASEAKIRELFKRASDVAPSILFLDELDSLAPRRGSDHTGVTDRVVNQLLTFLDGVEDNSGETVYVVAATSRPDKVDSAVLRPGRLEQHLFVGPPTTEEDLFDLFSKLCLEWNLTDDCQEKLSSIENANEILSLVIRGTGSIFPADIKAAFVTAHVNAVHRALEKQKPEEIQEVKICLDDLKSALQSARPSVSGKDAFELKEIYQKFQGKKKQSNDSSGKQPELKTTLR
ncbi:unnamed protein product [Cylindrotheca closterium]|uniref:Peroxisomal ATPase PEX1 n=1 Tax=Cylindrotheca closterium TaxID=2856 RepID=A0AAD2G3G1_9STRA|nr:unnamed protein product [Cylindrotheca closterium]